MPEHLLDQAVRLKARTFATRLAAVKNDLVGRDEAVDLVALATLCREHVLLIGPPGTAKTMLLDRFRRLLDASYFSYLLTRFTEPAELFGPLDIRSFQDEGKYRINTTGMLPEAHIAFLDEVFQGSSAILNTLLTLINERRYSNGAEVRDAELITLLGSSNDIPSDPLLAAFSDRFLLRCRLDYVADEAIEDVLRLGWTAEQDTIKKEPAAPTADAGFPLADLVELQRAVADIDLGGIRDPYMRILRAFRAEGVTFSDRRAVKAQKAFAASALLAGRRKAELADLAPLIHLWSDIDDELTIKRIVADYDVPVDDSGHVVRDPTEIAYDLGQLRRQHQHVKSNEEFRESLRRVHRLLIEVRRDHTGAQQLLSDLEKLRDEVLRAYRERYGEEALYV